jgi:FkbM family methyltransferase
MLLIDSRESVLGPALLLYGLWEPEITEWFQLNVKPSQVVVDVGANVGYYSLLAANLVGPEGRVVAVEAHPRMAELLFRNSIINGRPNITALNKAAWHQTERLTFHMRRHFAANSSVGAMEGSNLAKLDDFEDNVEVEAVRLDDVLAGFEHVDLIKIDVEGAELQVFMGLTETMASHPGIRVLFEWSPGQQKMLGTDPQAILDLLRTQGFALRHVEGGLCSISDEALLQLHHGNVLAER